MVGVGRTDGEEEGRRWRWRPQYLLELIVVVDDDDDDDDDDDYGLIVDTLTYERSYVDRSVDMEILLSIFTAKPAPTATTTTETICVQ